MTKNNSRKNNNLIKSATLKENSSLKILKSSNQTSSKNFNHFFENFMKIYAEEGYVEFDNNKTSKIIRVMETRISDDDDGKII